MPGQIRGGLMVPQYAECARCYGTGHYLLEQTEESGLAVREDQYTPEKDIYIEISAG